MKKGPEPRLVYSLDRDAAFGVVTGVLAAVGVLVALLATLPATAEVQARLGDGLAAAWRPVLLALAVAPLAAWTWFLPRFVRRIHWLPDDGLAMVERCGLLRRRTTILRPADIADVAARSGRFYVPGFVRVDAPYRRIRLHSGAVLWLDDQGTTVDAAALAALLAGRAPA